MKKVYFFLLVLFVIGISSVAGQAHQTLTPRQIFTATMTPGAVHTYRIQLRSDAEYFISWDDWDTNNDHADITVGVRGSQWGQYLIPVQDSGNYDLNVHRLVNQNNRNRSNQSTKVNPLNLPKHEGDDEAVFVPNSEYIIEVRGWGEDANGTYRIVFY